MIRKYTFGTPLPTDAVVQSLPAEEGELPYFETTTGEDGSVTFSIALHPEEVLFGLGQMVRGIDKRGHRYESWNSDVFNHTEERPSLYGSHNLLVFFSPERLMGVYLDDPGKIVWDLGYGDHDRAYITSENGGLDLYLIEEDTLAGKPSEGVAVSGFVPFLTADDLLNERILRAIDEDNWSHFSHLTYRLCFSRRRLRSSAVGVRHR